MTIMITKANSDYWVRFKEYNTLEDLVQECYNRHHPILLETNTNYKEDPEEILIFWHDIDLATAKKISSCEFQITIYNDYME